MLHIDAEISGVPKLAFLDGTPKRLFIDGKWVEARSGKTFTSFNPATGKAIAEVALGDSADIDLAVMAARRAFDGEWSFKYSNHAFGLVGLAIAAVTGESYNDWVAREIVAASGLEETTPDTPLPKRTPFASGHVSRLLMGEAFTIPSDNCTNALAAATGFVSTPGDLVRFYSSLDPAAKKSVISVESRREMTRRHWSVADMTLDRGYGLGTIHGSAGGWSWFGHSGGFQGSLSNTCAVPGQDIAVSAAINASESDPAAIVDGVLRILQVFAKHGAPSKKTADWKGRFWSLWGAADLVPVSDRVLVALPGLQNPFLDAAELTVTGPDTARISKATGFGSFGQGARLVRGKGGAVTEVVLAGGRLLDQASLAKEVRARRG